jgi:hypothetical protein
MGIALIDRGGGITVIAIGGCWVIARLFIDGAARKGGG